MHQRWFSATRKLSLVTSKSYFCDPWMSGCLLVALSFTDRLYLTRFLNIEYRSMQA
jgi:hypothetical protein